MHCVHFTKGRLSAISHQRSGATIIAITSCLAAIASTAVAFEGRINAVTIQGNQTNVLLYTVGPTSLRLEMTATNSDPSRAGWPNPVDILDRNCGTLTLLFPNNHSFVHLKPATDAATMRPPGMPGMPGMPAPFGAGPMPPSGLPPGIGPQPTPTSNVGVTLPAPQPMPTMPNMPALPPGIGPQTQATPAMPTMPPRPTIPNMPSGVPPGIGPQPASSPTLQSSIPPMPRMPKPMIPNAKPELQSTGQKTNLLGFDCEQFELKQRGETLEIWATDQLFPYQPYLQNQPHRFGPQRIEEQWPGMLTSRKLFPLLASLRYDNGAERFRFEVQSVTPQKLSDQDAKLFQPPEGWFEIQPLPF